MGLVFLFILATIMAFFGSVGYQRGVVPQVVALLILFVVLAAIGTRSGQLLGYMNGLYIGVMLVLKSGLNDLNQGDLESAAAKLEDIQRPFRNEGEALGLFILIILGVTLGLVVSFVLKGRRSVLGGLLGLFYGYVLSAALLPGVMGWEEGTLPIPFLLDGPEGAIDNLLPAPPSDNNLFAQAGAFLSDPANGQTLALLIVLLVTLFVILAGRSLARKG